VCYSLSPKLGAGAVNYVQEWSQSGVDRELIQLNVVALEGTQPYDYLCYSHQLTRRNDGRLSSGLLRRYAHTEAGGWWCAGVNLLTGTDDLWGCFKPVSPRIDPDRDKPIKYEHPPKIDTGVFALRVPLPLWRRIAERAGLTFDEAWIDPARPDQGFWSWLIQTPIVPICITEGAKKAGALLSAGYAAIALPGIHNGYRVPRDETGKRNGKSHLIPQLQVLAQANRSFYIAFDQDQKPSTIQAVQGAIRRLGYLLQQTGANVRVITWQPEAGKGVDDLLVNQGVEAFTICFQQATLLEIWKARRLSQLTYRDAVTLNHRYLPAALQVPDDAALVGIRSAKGTGKTEWLSGIVQQAIARKQPVLVIGHRVQLVENLCQRFGLPYVHEHVLDRPLNAPALNVSGSNAPNALSETQVSEQFETRLGSAQHGLGYGLCIDSLHPDSQAKFNPEDWRDAIVIIDEVEQVLWHSLNSDTCRGQRVEVLRSLKRLMQNTLGAQGQVLVADADLSDVALDYLLALAGVEHQPYIIRNTWTPATTQAWQVTHYTESTPKRLLAELDRHIAAGGRPFVCLSAQKLKSKWSTTALEAYFQQKFPHLRLLRIDSESVSDPKHPAYRCTHHLDQRLQHYDVVLASPSIETGVSIDLCGHFTSVWAIAQGIQSENSVRQSLSRVREAVPRHLWLAPYGFNKIGNGSASIPSLLTSGQQLTRLNVRLLQQCDFSDFEDFDTGFQAESLQCWAKMAVRINATMGNYRETIVQSLQEEGHQIAAFVSIAKSRTKARKPRFLATSADRATANLTANLTATQPEQYPDQAPNQQPDQQPAQQMQAHWRSGNLGSSDNLDSLSTIQTSPVQAGSVQTGSVAPLATSCVIVDDGDRQILNALNATIAAVRDQNYQAECRQIARATDLHHRQYQSLKKRLVKSASDRFALRKYELKRRYGVPVTIDLVRKDDHGWYDKLRLHYFLTVGREFLTDRDQRVARQLLQQGNGQVFQPDFNRSQLGATIGIFELLNIPVLLDHPERELRNSDTDLQALAKRAIGSRDQIKSATGIGLAKNSTPIVVVRRFLDKLGYGLQQTRWEGCRKTRERIYQLEQPQDGRVMVFEQWLTTDRRFPGWSEGALHGGDNFMPGEWLDARSPLDGEGEQLSLSLRVKRD